MLLLFLTFVFIVCPTDWVLAQSVNSTPKPTPATDEKNKVVDPVITHELINQLPWKTSNQRPQKYFMFEQRRPFKRPIKLPPAALQLLRSEISNKRGCSLKETTDISHWFKASRIDLGGNRRAYIARSYEDCLNGIDNDWFWIILKTRRTYRLLLHAGTISLSVRDTWTHGLPDIETNIGTGSGDYTNIYKYDGAVYKPDSCWFTSWATEKRKLIPCQAQ